MSHPIEPDAEDTSQVFLALVETLPESEQTPWLVRWAVASNVEQRRRAYDRKWDDSLLGVTRYGQ